MPFKFTTRTATVRARGILHVNRRGKDDPCPGELHLFGVESLHVLLSNLGHGEGQALLGLDAGVGHLLRGTSVNFSTVQLTPHVVGRRLSLVCSQGLSQPMPLTVYATCICHVLLRLKSSEYASVIGRSLPSPSCSAPPQHRVHPFHSRATCSFFYPPSLRTSVSSLSQPHINV